MEKETVPCLSLFLSLSLCVSLCLCVYLSLSLSLYLCVCVSLSLPLSLSPSLSLSPPLIFPCFFCYVIFASVCTLCKIVSSCHDLLVCCCSWPNNDQWSNEMHHSPHYPHEQFRHRSPPPSSFGRDQGSFRGRAPPPQPPYGIQDSYRDHGPGGPFHERSPRGGYSDRNPPSRFRDLSPPGQFWDHSPERHRNQNLDRHRDRSPDRHRDHSTSDHHRDRSPLRRSFSPPRVRSSGRWDRQEPGPARSARTSVSKSGNLSGTYW